MKNNWWDYVQPSGHWYTVESDPGEAIIDMDGLVFANWARSEPKINRDLVSDDAVVINMEEMYVSESAYAVWSLLPKYERLRFLNPLSVYGEG